MQLCSGAAVSLSACSALSRVQEAPSVSAVSLTANEFPGGGVVLAVCVCVCVMGVWMVATTAWEKGRGEKHKKNTAARMLWEPGFRTPQQEELLSQRCLCPLCCARLLIVKPQRGLHTEAGVTHVTGTLQYSAIAHIKAFATYFCDLLCCWELFNNIRLIDQYC